jgi:hypothetical protein
MVTKSDVLIICILVFCDQIVGGLTKYQSKVKRRSKTQTKTTTSKSVKQKVVAKDGTQDEDEVKSRSADNGEVNLELNKYGIPMRGRFPGAGGPIGNIVGTGQSITIKKGTLSGLAKLIDDRFIQIDRFGNPFGGLPEDMLGHVRFCA